jgi:SAM-dependent methyltransferase
MTQAYWQDAAADEAMQEEHRFIWEAMLEIADVKLAGRRVLDAGCNQGGFLRMLVDEHAIAEGYGYDPASAAIEDARRLTGGRPLEFAASDALPVAWSGFDLAFSHEVLFLIEDLPAHARAMFAALNPGGAYFATIGVHADSPLMVAWHRDNAARLGMPPIYDIATVVSDFEAAGFDAALGRLPFRFIPSAGHLHHEHGRLLDWVDYYENSKLILRLRRPL